MGSMGQTATPKAGEVRGRILPWTDEGGVTATGAGPIPVPVAGSGASASASASASAGVGGLGGLAGIGSGSASASPTVGGLRSRYGVATCPKISGTSIPLIVDDASDTANPFIQASPNYDRWTSFCKSLIIATSVMVNSQRQTIHSIIGMSHGTDKCTVDLLRLEIIRLCVGLPRLMYIRAVMYGVASSGLIPSPELLLEQFMKSPESEHEKLITELAAKLVANVEKVDDLKLPKLTFQKMQLESGSSTPIASRRKTVPATSTPATPTTPSSKSSPKTPDVSIIDSKTGKDTPVPAHRYLNVGMGEHQNGTVLDLLNLYALSTVSHLFAKQSADVTSVDVSTKYGPKNKQHSRVYGTDLRGSVSKWKDMAKEVGVTAGGSVSHPRVAMMTVPKEDASKLVALAREPLWKQATSWDTLTPPPLKKSLSSNMSSLPTKSGGTGSTHRNRKKPKVPIFADTDSDSDSDSASDYLSGKTSGYPSNAISVPSTIANLHGRSVHFRSTVSNFS